MRALASAWPDHKKVQQLAAQIPWFHNCIIIDKITAPEEREWYILQTIQNGWSRSILERPTIVRCLCEERSDVIIPNGFASINLRS